MDLQQETIAVEKELLELIVEHLRNNEIQAEEAKKLASDFLANLPFQDQKDLLEKLKALGEKYEEAKEVYVQEFAKASNTQRDQVLTQMRNEIAKGNMEGALTAAKSLSQAN